MESMINSGLVVYGIILVTIALCFSYLLGEAVLRYRRSVSGNTHKDTPKSSPPESEALRRALASIATTIKHR